MDTKGCLHHAVVELIVRTLRAYDNTLYRYPHTKLIFMLDSLQKIAAVVNIVHISNQHKNKVEI